MARRGYSAAGELLEDAFTGQVIELARYYGWRTAHFRPAQTGKGWRTPVAGDGKGFPDLVLVRPPELIFAELKTDKGRVAPAQKEWLERLLAVAAVETYVWRPRDFDELHARLARGRHRQEPIAA